MCIIMYLALKVDAMITKCGIAEIESCVCAKCIRDERNIIGDSSSSFLNFNNNMIFLFQFTTINYTVIIRVS